MGPQILVTHIPNHGSLLERILNGQDFEPAYANFAIIGFIEPVPSPSRPFKASKVWQLWAPAFTLKIESAVSGWKDSSKILSSLFQTKFQIGSNLFRPLTIGWLSEFPMVSILGLGEVTELLGAMHLAARLIAHYAAKWEENYFPQEWYYVIRPYFGSGCDFCLFAWFL